MEEYKLVYLKYRGRAELIRFIFAHADVKYDDHREEPEKWTELRPGRALAFTVNINASAYYISFTQERSLESFPI